MNIYVLIFSMAIGAMIGTSHLAFAGLPLQAADSRGTYSDAKADSILAAVEADIGANRLDQAEPRLTSYLGKHPNSWEAYYDLGYVQFRTHQIGPSVKNISKSLELNSNNAEAHKVLALDCSIIGRYDLAEIELQQAERLKPESAEIHYFLARTYYTRGVYPLAKSEFETAIRLDSSYIKAYSSLGITLESLGDTDGALRNYRAAIRLEDRQPQKSELPYVYLSAFYNRQHSPSQALVYAGRAVEINPKADTAYFEMAKAYRTEKQFDKAVEAIRKAISVNPGISDYYYVLGLTLRELDKTAESTEALKKYGELQKRSKDSLLESQEPLAGPEPQ